MADQRISDLTPLVGADLAADDLFVVVDTSTSSTKHIRRDELIKVLTASPATGQIVYYNGTTFTGLTIGTTGQALFVNGAGTLPEWADLPAQSFQFLGRAVASNDATIDFTYDETAFDAVMFVCANVVPATNSVDFLLRTSDDGGASFANGGSAYQYTYWDMRLNGSSPTYAGGTASSVTMINGVGSGGDEDGVSALVTLYGPGLSRDTHINWNGGYSDTLNIRYAIGGGAIRADSAIVNGVRFFFSSGNLESGTITAYGVRNS